MFKNTISVLTGVLVLVGASLLPVLSPVTCHAAVVDGISLPSPQGIDGNDYENPVIHRSLTTSLGSLPSSITNASIGTFSNNTFRVVHDSDYAFTVQFGSSGVTNATASNQVAYLDLSPDGLLWATNSPLTFSMRPAASNNTYQVIINSTNFGPNVLARFRGMTNAGSVGNGSVTPNKVVITSWRVRQIRQN